MSPTAGGKGVGAERGERVRDRFGLLLLLLVATFVALGFGESTLGRVIGTALEIATVVVGLLATGVRRDVRLLMFGLVLATAALVVASASQTDGIAFGIASAVSAVVMAVILVAVVDRVLRHTEVTIQTIYGALSAYFLIALLFTGLFGALDGFSNQPFFGQQEPRSVYSYFSFTTLTTVGFGDFTAQTDLARRIVVLEAVIGQMFLATLVARLVSMYKSTPSRRRPGPPAPDPSDDIAPG